VDGGLRRLFRLAARHSARRLALGHATGLQRRPAASALVTRPRQCPHAKRPISSSTPCLALGSTAHQRARSGQQSPRWNTTLRPSWPWIWPSGLASDTSAAPGGLVRATVTLTLLGLKPGLLTGPDAQACGELWLNDLNAQPASAQPLTSPLTHPRPKPAPDAPKLVYTWQGIWQGQVQARRRLTLPTPCRRQGGLDGSRRSRLCPKPSRRRTRVSAAMCTFSAAPPA
jgi:Uncharacterized conserved protein